MSSRGSRAVSFLVRAAAFFAAAYVLWLPLQRSYTRFLALLAGPLVRLVDDPPTVSTLVARDNAIAFFSFLTGFREPMASWDGETTAVYVLAPLALVLATPGLRWRARIAATAVVLAVSVAVSAGISAVQIRLAADLDATNRLGIALHTASERAALDRINDALHVIGMLAFPALVFVAAYAYGAWLAPSDDTERSARDSHRSGPVLASAVAIGLILAWAAMGAAASPSTDSADYGAAWVKILRLNPDFAPAQINVALQHEAAGRLDEAIALYRSAVRARPDAVETHYNLGNALRRKGSHADAVESYERVLAIAPDHSAAHRNIGLAYAHLDRPCKAARHLELSRGLRGSTESDVLLEQEILRMNAACAEPASASDATVP